MNEYNVLEQYLALANPSYKFSFVSVWSILFFLVGAEHIGARLGLRSGLQGRGC